MVAEITREKFYAAVSSNDVAEVTRMLAEDASLANADLRPETERDEFTHGFPLVIAAGENFLELALVLLAHGADPNSRSTAASDPPEYGMPLHHAVRHRNYSLAHSLLDGGGDPNSFPHCDQSTIEVAFYLARENGISYKAVRQAYIDWLPPDQTDSKLTVRSLIGVHPNESVRMFARLVDLGGSPQLGALVREGFADLIEEILHHSASKPGSPHDHPKGTTFENILGSARWHGYPDIIISMMKNYPQYFDYDVLIETIKCAVISHNRDGHYRDYRRIIATQLEELASRGLIHRAIRDAEFNPIYMMATGFTWHENYGYRAPIAAPDCYIDLAQLFTSFGLADVNYQHPEPLESPLLAAVKRGHHPGISVFIEWLLEEGADMCPDSTAEMSAIEIAKERGYEEIANMLKGKAQCIDRAEF